MDLVGLVLETIDLDDVLVEAAPLFEFLGGQQDLLGGAQDDVGEFAGAVAQVLHAIQTDAATGRVDHVHHVVEIQDERVDVFAIQRRDERLVQPIEGVVGDLVALVFERLEFVGRGPARHVAREHVDEDDRGLADLLRELDEVVEEATIFRDQAESSHTTLLDEPTNLVHPPRWRGLRAERVRWTHGRGSSRRASAQSEGKAIISLRLRRGL